MPHQKLIKSFRLVTVQKMHVETFLFLNLFNRKNIKLKLKLKKYAAGTCLDAAKI